MPTYIYKCVRCSKIEQVVHRMNEEYTDPCVCGGRMNKVFHPTSVSFKGSGFYSTDKNSSSKPNKNTDF